MIAVATALILAGLVAVAPPAAAGRCDQDPDEFPEVRIGGEDEEDITHACVDIDTPPETVPFVNATVKDPNVDPTPALPGGPGGPPGVEPPPPQPGTPPEPPRDTCTLGVCHPSISGAEDWATGSVLDWAVGIVTDFRHWARNVSVDCGGGECADVTPTLDWVEKNAGNVVMWADNTVDSVHVGQTQVKTLSRGDTHVNGNRTVDEVCEIVFGSNADPQDCTGPATDLVPCNLERIGQPGQCNVTVEAGVSWDGDGGYTPGIVVESPKGRVFVPATEVP